MTGKSCTRQAVVLIHGIGEQMPMKTTRGFVEAIRPKGKWRVYSEADRADERFELHTFVVPACIQDGKEIPQTDFYEGYWAEEARGTRVAHVWRWARRVFLTGVFKAPPRLRWLYGLAAGLAVLAVAALILLVFTPAGRAISSGAVRIPVQIIVPLLLAAASGWILNSLGDLARYTDDHPDNVDMRQAIRQRVVGLLDKLHDDGRYNRIIVIGHSLGGIVAYDALRLLWAKRTGGDTGDLPGQVDDQKVAEAAAPLMTSAATDTDRMLFAGEQKNLGDDLRTCNIPVWQTVCGQPQQVLRPVWLVTDLVTLGSPIAYPELLLADGDKAEYEALKKERQLPTCPPRPADDSRPGYRYEPAAGVGMRYHHGAVFAATRWTNAFWHGDFAGAPIDEHNLGTGVINRELPGGLPIISHSRYWAAEEGRNIITCVIDHPSDCHELILKHAEAG